MNTEESDKFAHTIVEVNKQYFIGNDNGIFSLLFDEKPQRMIEMNIPQDSNHFTFSSRDRFAKAAVHLAKGGQLEELGNPKTSIVQKMLLKPVTDPDVLKGHVIYIDVYENLITNILESVFNEIRKNRKFSILFRSYEIKKISQSYTDVAPGEILALFGSNGNLEIAMNQGNAAGLLGLDYKDMVRIEFS
jgi:S-adenosylmethionine hydrolase